MEQLQCYKKALCVACTSPHSLSLPPCPIQAKTNQSSFSAIWRRWVCPVKSCWQTRLGQSCSSTLTSTQKSRSTATAGCTAQVRGRHEAGGNVWCRAWFGYPQRSGLRTASLLLNHALHQAQCGMVLCAVWASQSWLRALWKGVVKQQSRSALPCEVALHESLVGVHHLQVGETRVPMAAPSPFLVSQRRICHPLPLPPPPLPPLVPRHRRHHHRQAHQQRGPSLPRLRPALPCMGLRPAPHTSAGPPAPLDRQQRPLRPC